MIHVIARNLHKVGNNTHIQRGVLKLGHRTSNVQVNSGQSKICFRRYSQTNKTQATTPKLNSSKINTSRPTALIITVMSALHAHTYYRSEQDRKKFRCLETDIMMKHVSTRVEIIGAIKKQQKN